MANKYHTDPQFTMAEINAMLDNGEITLTQHIAFKVKLKIADPSYVPPKNSEVFKFVAEKEKQEADAKAKAEKVAAKAAAKTAKAKKAK